MVSIVASVVRISFSCKKEEESTLTNLDTVIEDKMNEKMVYVNLIYG